MLLYWNMWHYVLVIYIKAWNNISEIGSLSKIKSSQVKQLYIRNYTHYRDGNKIKEGDKLALANFKNIQKLSVNYAKSENNQMESIRFMGKVQFKEGQGAQVWVMATSRVNERLAIESLNKNCKNLTLRTSQEIFKVGIRD